MNNAIITGASSGIGKAVAQYLYSEGWHVCMTDVDEKNLSALSQNWDKTRYSLYPMDVTNEAQVHAVVQAYCQSQGKQLRLLFNCAGILDIGHFEAIPLNKHHAIIDVNVKGILNTCHHSFEFLKNTQSAQVINMSSASATYGVPTFASYSASKFAVKGLTEALELEWEQYDISVSDIMPPFVSTNMLSSQTGHADVIQRLGVNLTPQDVVNALAKQIQSPILHRPVSIMFSILFYLNSISPTWLNRLVMKKLSQ
jgi:NADP-dependent 3-hydroxy acid dehydrogenase YdfG